MSPVPVEVLKWWNGDGLFKRAERVLRTRLALLEQWEEKSHFLSHVCFMSVSPPPTPVCLIAGREVSH